MTAYMLMDIDIHDPEGYSKYPPQVWPLIARHGGKITHRMNNFEVVEGDWCPRRVLLAEFPDKAAAMAFFEDPDYLPIKELRLNTSSAMIVLGDAEG